MRRRTLALFSTGLACLMAVAWLTACGSKDADGEKSNEADAGEAKADRAPKIVAVEGEHDFGKVKQGKAVEHVFKLKNEGTADLKIEKARGS